MAKNDKNRQIYQKTYVFSVIFIKITQKKQQKQRIISCKRFTFIFLHVIMYAYAMKLVKAEKQIGDFFL